MSLEIRENRLKGGAIQKSDTGRPKQKGGHIGPPLQAYRESKEGLGRGRPVCLPGWRSGDCCAEMIMFCFM
jgi:hypothetical protein